MKQILLPTFENLTPPPAQRRLAAVMDVGTTSIRMVVAEVSSFGPEHPVHVRKIDQSIKSVALGKDTFLTGRIHKHRIEQCVQILQGYREKLLEYGIDSTENVKVFATSSVREAENRLEFQDRIFIATGLTIHILDEAEVQRTIFLGIQPLIKRDPKFWTGQTVVVEVGGGTTELLILKDQDVVYSQGYRLGSYRLRETLEAYQTSDTKIRQIMEIEIQRVVERIPQHLDPSQPVKLVALGGDIRLAADQLMPEWDQEPLGKLPLASLYNLAYKLIDQNVDEISQDYHLSSAEAESIGPALLSYHHLARTLGLKDLYISQANLRDGLIAEVATGNLWTDALKHQIRQSAISLGQKFAFDEAYAVQVCESCLNLFSQLKKYHQLSDHHELMLAVAALLHEIGMSISTAAYHKHSMYMIMASDLFGMSKSDLHLIALIARYHRRSSPKPTHTPFVTLTREDRISVIKLAALLRIAIALNASRHSRKQEFVCRKEKNRMVIMLTDRDDVSLEQISIRQNGPLFEQVFGLPVTLRVAKKT